MITNTCLVKHAWMLISKIYTLAGGLKLLNGLKDFQK